MSQSGRSMTSASHAAVSAYFQALVQKLQTGQAREHAYRPLFEVLMKSLDTDIQVVNDPKRSEHGSPDFVYLRNKLPIGYAETKDVGLDLAKVEQTEQMKRYYGYANLILTDYLEFRFYKDGQRVMDPIIIGKVVGDSIQPNPEQFGMLADALTDFLRGTPEPIKSGLRLAQIMGGKARRIRDNVLRFFAQQEQEKTSDLWRMYETVKKLLVHDLKIDAFADMYAQTLVYGLFVARYSDPSPKDFTRQEARDLVPLCNPFLREFFDHIVGPRFEQRLQIIVDELCMVFSVSDVHLLVQKHLRLLEVPDEKDPIIHFYEDFLKEYDAEIRKKMGAYYTPIPVVRFIVRSVDELLKREFGLAKGLADTSKRTIHVATQGLKSKPVEFHRVQILDPAVGTATFLNEIVRHVYKTFQGQEGRWPAYVEADLLPRLHGFELMMAPYTIAHLKLGMTLQETGVTEFHQRLGVYLTNTLEEGHKVDDSLFASLGLAQSIAQEAEAAGRIKHEKPIMVVIGNPPYSGVSSNETDYANSLIDKYKVEPGGKQKLQERKHWLNDDYVKFIAFAEDLIEKNGDGIVAMITNHGYLDNPTFRGMRWHLAKTFDVIQVLDLHGNTKKKETTPDGGKDENVFDIQQGVAIILAVKTGKKKKDALAQVFHADLFGKRSEKFRKLEEGGIEWKEIGLDEKMLFFAQKNLEGIEAYREFIGIQDLFPVNVTGIVTARDGVVIDFSKQDLLGRMKRFSDLNFTDDETRAWLFPGKKSGKYLAGDSRGWKLAIARRAVADEESEKMIQKVSYRPFDTRSIYYSPKMVDWGRFDFMQHLLNRQNLGLIVTRLNRQASLGYYFVANSLADFHILDGAGDSTSVLPLYLYHPDNTRTPNFDRDVLKIFTKNLAKPYAPENILDYIYAVLHSPSYRETYKEFLKTDFPRVPAPENDDQFHRYAGFGKELRELHLLTSTKVHSYLTTYPKGGSNEVEKVEYKNGNVFINPEQFFGTVPEVAWNFYIGGYQPAQKWLKDRKGRQLSNEEIEHYQQMIVALTETDKLMKQIDQVELL